MKAHCTSQSWRGCQSWGICNWRIDEDQLFQTAILIGIGLGSSNSSRHAFASQQGCCTTQKNTKRRFVERSNHLNPTKLPASLNKGSWSAHISAKRWCERVASRQAARRWCTTWTPRGPCPVCTRPGRTPSVDTIKSEE